MGPPITSLLPSPFDNLVTPVSCGRGYGDYKGESLKDGWLRRTGSDETKTDISGGKGRHKQLRLEKRDNILV